MDFVEFGQGGSPDEVQSTLRFSEELLAELGPSLNSEEEAAIAALPSGSALLITKRGPNVGSRFLLDQELTSAGRHPNADIFLDDVTVSRRHAEFVRTSNGFVVKDLASLNGTYHNGTRIDDLANLSDGDEVQIGKFRLTFFAAQGDRKGSGA
jgi:pSer/pThr/pTyr-binding forkhead associated (FHA) protein